MNRRRLFAEWLEDRDLMSTFAVATTGNDSSGDGSAAAPFRTIQHAVNLAASGDTVLVAGGTYTYDASQDTASIQATGTRNVVTVFNKTVNIYGGFSTATGFQAANPQANPTVIDGQSQFRGMFITGFGNPTGADVEGVIIRNGLGAPIPARGGEDTIYGFGGGAFLDFSDTRARNNAVPTTFKNVTFENNQAVGSPGNAADPTLNFGGAGAGGGLELRYANDVELDNVVFRNNVAQGGTGNQRGGVGNGGAIHVDHSTVTGSNLLFDGNKALSGNGNAGSTGRDSRLGLKADGTGGAVSVQVDSLGTFTQVTALNNVTTGGNSDNEAGDAFGGAFFAEQATLTIRDAVIFNNLAQGGTGYLGQAGGGGIETDRSNLTLDRVKVSSNRAVGGARVGTAAGAGPVGGGGIYSTRINQPASAAGTIMITNSVIDDNRAELAATSDSSTGGAGAGLWLQGVDATITHTTIANNTFGPNLTFGQAILLINDGTQTPTTLNLSYSLVTGHDTGSSAVTLFNGTTLNLNTNLFQNRSTSAQIKVEALGSGANSGNAGVVNGQGTTLSGNPGYTSPSAPNFDYSLAAMTSPAVNAATGSATTTDIGNATRTGTPDLGAYEFGTSGAEPVLAAATGAVVSTGVGGLGNSPPPPPPPPPGSVKPSLVGYPQFAAGADTGGGVATLYNADGTGRFSVTPFPGFTGGVRTAASDFNGDGIADLVVGTGPGTATQVQVIDGATQAVLFSTAAFEASFVGGIYVTAGDVTGDGRADLIVTPDEGGGPRVDVYNGNGFQKIISFFGIDDPNFRGGARAAVSDLNGDGQGDLVVVAGFGGGPRVAAFNGNSLTSAAPVKLFNDFFAFEQSLRNGIFVAAGDVNGDGFADLIAGGGPGGGPRVLVLSGKDLLSNTQTPLANFFGGDVNSRGGIRLAVKNLDGDTKADLVVGSGSGAGSRVTSYLGSNLGLGNPAAGLNFDSFAGFTGGVFVG